MAFSKVVVVAFVIIFLGFVGLLVLLKIHTSNDQLADDFEQEISHDPSIDYLFDTVNILEVPCSACPPTSLRQLFCNQSKFALVVHVTDLSIDPPLMVIEEWSQLKRFPHISGDQLHIEQSDSEECQVAPQHDKVYLVTGYIGEDDEPYVSPCDALIEWSSLSVHLKHAYFNFFSPVLRCWPFIFIKLYP